MDQAMKGIEPNLVHLYQNKIKLRHHNVFMSLHP